MSLRLEILYIYISHGEIAQVTSSKVVRMSALSKTLFVKSVLWEDVCHG